MKQLRPKSTPSTRRLKVIAGEDLYEAYLFMRVLSAARRRGITLTLLGEQSQRPAREIIFRRSPGTLHHASRTAPDYTYARLTGRGWYPRALFVGIKALDHSGGTHECDLLLLPERVAQHAQRSPSYPLWGSADLYVEAKFNSKEITLPTARALIGIHADLWFRRAVVLACHDGLATNAKTYLQAGAWMASAAGFGDVRPASNGHNQLENHLATLL